MSDLTTNSQGSPPSKPESEMPTDGTGTTTQGAAEAGHGGTSTQSSISNEAFHSFRKSHSNESGGSGGSNHSSGMLSIGNTSFGFAFDSDPMMQLGGSSSGVPSEKTSEGENSDNSEKPTTLKLKNSPTDASAMAEANVANLQSLARAQVASLATNSVAPRKRSEPDAPAAASLPQHPPPLGQNDDSVASHDADDEDDYFDDNNSRSTTDQMQQGDESQPKRKKKRLDERKRVERNAREKERSFRISKQINDLRSLLSSGGVIVPKGTKSSVLTEAANYIRMLQQHQYRSEIDRHQLIQQMQLIGGGAHGAQAAQAIRHVAAQNGVWSLGNFGGVPPKSALLAATPDKNSSSGDFSASPDPNKVNTDEYRFIFNSCGVGMAIASMGGAFIDCNQLFCQLSNYTKQEVCSLTIFNMTARQDLQTAFDMISQLISPPMEGPVNKVIAVRGSFKNRDDLGLCVNVVKGDDGIAKCFCVTIIKNPTSPFDGSPPVPVSFESLLSTGDQNSMTKGAGQVGAAPAFTSG